MRIQTREDGLSIDQILLIPGAAPPLRRRRPRPAPSATLKVLDWNTHHGIGTDGTLQPRRASSPTS